MNVSKTPARKRFAVIALIGFGLAALSLSGCNKSTDPEAPFNPCLDNDSLCVSKAVLLDTGEFIFQTCAGCHGSEGEGGRGPNVRNSDYAMGSRERLIRTVLNGVVYGDSITVNGHVWQGGEMPSWRDIYSNVEIAGVLTYIRSVLNDSLVSNCVVNPEDEFDVTCTKTARLPADMAKDTIAVWEVKAVKDTLDPPPTE